MENRRNNEWLFPIIALVAVILVAGGVFLAIKPKTPTLVQPSSKVASANTAVASTATAGRTEVKAQNKTD